MLTSALSLSCPCVSGKRARGCTSLLVNLMARSERSLYWTPRATLTVLKNAIEDFSASSAYNSIARALELLPLKGDYR